MWPTNTIRICQSASHTFTVVSWEAVTMASTSSQYAKSEMMLEVREWEAQQTQHSPVCGSYSPCSNWLSLRGLSPNHLPPTFLLRFVQIPAHIN